MPPSLKPQTIGTYETKTHLAEILRQVQAGQAFIITQRRQAVAELLPTGTHTKRSAQAAAERMRAFASSQIARSEAIDTKAWSDAGRD